MKRRKFIVTTANSIIGMSLFGSHILEGKPSLSKEIGIQLYTVARPLSEDFLGTIKKLAKYGYKNLEFAGPYFYSTQEEIDNNTLIKMMGLTGYGYYKYNPKEIRQILDDLGLISTSAHVSDQSLKDSMDKAIESALTIGHKFLVSPMFMGQSIDDYKSAAELYNVFGEKCKSAGLKYGYHTHSHEFGNYDGISPFDVLIKNTDPGLVVFELDLFWARVAGIDPVKLIHNNPGRIKLLHIKDMKEKMERTYTTNETFTNMEISMKVMGNQTAVGEGIIDFKSIISQVKDDIDYMFVESDFPKEPMELAEKSISNLKNMI